jgi:hypothetical protein
MSFTAIRTTAPAAAVDVADSEKLLSAQLGDWHRRVRSFGQSIAPHRCQDEREAASVVRSAEALSTDLLVVDCGAARQDGELSQALKDCGVPYVEVHRDDGRHLEQPLPCGQRRIPLVQGYGQRGLDLALWVAYDALGGPASNDDYHVCT